MSEINVSVSVLKCKIPLCSDPPHFGFIENFNEQFIFAIKTALKHFLLSKRKQTNNFIYGWNNNVKRTHITARAAYLNRIKNGKIRNGKYNNKAIKFFEAHLNMLFANVKEIMNVIRLML